MRNDQINDAVTLAALQNAMSGTAAGASQATPTLGDLLHPAVMKPALESPEMIAELPKLATFLPDGEAIGIDSVLGALRSPALRAQAASLTNALASGGAGDLIATFGLPSDNPNAAAAVGAAGVQAFFASLRRVPRKEE